MSGGNKTEINIAVLGEKIDSLRELMETKFSENYKQHNFILERQDTANHRTTKLEDWKETHTREIEKEITSVLKVADKRYASKSVEIHFNKIVYAVVIAVIMAGIGLFLK